MAVALAVTGQEQSSVRGKGRTVSFVIRPRSESRPGTVTSFEFQSLFVLKNACYILSPIKSIIEMNIIQL